MRRVFLVSVCCFLVPAAIAQDLDPTPIADRGEGLALLALYDGRWTADGTTRTTFEDDPEPGRCNMVTTFDANAGTLTNEGRCATATATRAATIEGDLALAEGGRLTGGYFDRLERAELLESTGILHQDGFIVETRYLLTLAGEPEAYDVIITASRPTVQSDGATTYSLTVDVLDPETGELVDFSTMVFRRTGDR